MTRNEELSRFLKEARSRVAPEDVGLPAGLRRRAKGLRREELASLAGMSVTWYTWFEQGREVQLSAQMLERLSTVLRLTPQEREFLFALAQHRPPPFTGEIDLAVPASVQRLMDMMGLPALVMAADWTVIGWNQLTQRLFRDYSALPAAERNLFRILLLSPEYQSDEEEYRAMARRLIARYKWDHARARPGGSFDRTIEDLERISAIFREYWRTSGVIAHFEGVHAADVPEVGRILLQHTSYEVEQSPTQRLVVFAPMDDISAERLKHV